MVVHLWSFIVDIIDKKHRPWSRQPTSRGPSVVPACAVCVACDCARDGRHRRVTTERPALTSLTQYLNHKSPHSTVCKTAQQFVQNSKLFFNESLGPRPAAARATNTQQTWRQDFLGSRSSNVERSSTRTAAAGTFLWFLQTIFENTSLWRLKRLVTLSTYRRYINKCIYLSIYLSTTSVVVIEQEKIACVGRHYFVQGYPRSLKETCTTESPYATSH